MNPLDIEEKEIDLSELPETMQEIIEVLGFKKALLLSHCLGGTDIYIPERFEEGGKIADFIGWNEYRDLWEIYRKAVLSIPKTDVAVRLVKHNKVVELKQARKTNKEIALLTGYTVRHVLRIVKEYKEGLHKSNE